MVLIEGKSVAGGAAPVFQAWIGEWIAFFNLVVAEIPIDDRSQRIDTTSSRARLVAGCSAFRDPGLNVFWRHCEKVHIAQMFDHGIYGNFENLLEPIAAVSLQVIRISFRNRHGRGRTLFLLGRVVRSMRDSLDDFAGQFPQPFFGDEVGVGGVVISD